MSFWSRLSLFLTLVVYFTGVLAGNARIQSQKSRLPARQGSDQAFDGPKTVQAVTTFNTPAGVKVQTCTITLTPTVSDTGEHLVLEDRRCSTQFTPSVDSGNSTTTTSASVGESTSLTDSSSSTAAVATTTADATTTATDVASTSTVDSSSSSSTDALATSADATSSAEVTASASSASETSTPVVTSTVTSSAIATQQPQLQPVLTTSASTDPLPATDASSTTSAAPSSASKAPAISVIGTSSVVRTDTTSSAVSTPDVGLPDNAAAPAVTTAASTDNGNVTSASGLAPTPTPTAAEDQATLSPSGDPSTTATLAAVSSAPSPIQLPGTKLSVLPIGLGVFGGISAIAILVVAYVMWERTKYRKNFRARQKLSDQGARTGYGGMSQRV
ncbi:hypothetical protein FRB99_000008 [Tulasnella sp. 403]|nr:hypothetical protein FRB99_000008 [Tulasnella sp. 403]